MKKIGSLLFSFALIVLFGVVLFQFIGVNKNNPGDTISIAKARDLVNMACAACVGEDLDSLSTVSVEEYEYDYVRPIDAGGDSYLQALFFFKYALADSEAGNGSFMSSTSGVEVYSIYELTEKGIVMDMLMATDGVSSAINRTVLELYFSDEDKNSWVMCFSMVDFNNEIENYNHANDNKILFQYNVFANGTKITRFESIQVQVDQTFYGNNLTKNNLIASFSSRIDSTIHEQEAKSFGEVDMAWNGSIGTFTDDELYSLVSFAQNYCKNAYSPKFYGVEFEETDFFDMFMEEFN